MKVRTFAVATALLAVAGFCAICVADNKAPAAPVSDAKTQASSPEKLKDIKTLLEMMGAGKGGIQAMSQMIANFKKTLPSVPEKFWTDFMAEASPDDLENLIVPVYDRHFTHEEIKGLIAFYKSPLGKKFTDEQPAILRESMTAGQEWGRKLGEKIAAKLKAEGYSLPAK